MRGSAYGQSRREKIPAALSWIENIKRKQVLDKVCTAKRANR